MNTPPDDRRSEPRRAVLGEIRLRQNGIMAAAFMGNLLDLSAHGFRIRHSRLTLASGDRVEFEFQGRSGMARAVWNRIVDCEAETGFQVIGEIEPEITSQ